MITAKAANNKAFKAKETKELLKEKHYLEVLKHVEDRIYEYIVQFYNGDTWLDEVLEEELSRLK